jgi:hypothetical protein
MSSGKTRIKAIVIRGGLQGGRKTGFLWSSGDV